MLTPAQVYEIGRRRRAGEQELAARIARTRQAMLPVHQTIAGNARITVTAKGRTGKPSRSAVANTLRGYAR